QRGDVPRVVPDAPTQDEWAWGGQTITRPLVCGARFAPEGGVRVHAARLVPGRVEGPVEGVVTRWRDERPRVRHERLLSRADPPDDDEAAAAVAAFAACDVV